MSVFPFKKIHLLSLFCVVMLILCLVSFCFTAAEEQLVITTYYPAPYGVYKELRADRMSIGSAYRDQALTDGELIVWDRVGIGTPVPETFPTRLQIKDGGLFIKNDDEIISMGYDNLSPELVLRDLGGDSSGLGGGYIDFTNDDISYDVRIQHGWGIGNNIDGTLLIRGNPQPEDTNVGIGTLTPKGVPYSSSAAPGNLTGNLDVNDIWLRAADNNNGKWLSQVSDYKWKPTNIVIIPSGDKPHNAGGAGVINTFPNTAGGPYTYDLSGYSELNNAKQILVYVWLAKQAGAAGCSLNLNNCARTFRIYTKEPGLGGSEYSQNITIFDSQNSGAWVVNSDNLWFPLTSEKKIYIYLNQNIDGYFAGAMYIIGYR